MSIILILYLKDEASIATAATMDKYLSHASMLYYYYYFFFCRSFKYTTLSLD